jgi:hypothetical protein
MAKQSVVEIPGALREEERFATEDDAKQVEERMKAATEAEVNAPLEAAEAEKQALEARAEEATENAEHRREVRTQRARAILGEAQTPKAEAAERRPAEQPRAKEARKSDASGDK